MSDSNLFKPQTSSSGLGSKAMNKGQFANPPAYPETSGFSGPSKTVDDDAKISGLEKTPGAKKGRV